MWETIVLILYSVSMFFIALFSIGQLGLLILFLRNRKKKHSPLIDITLPQVTVQLPIYNERYVVKGLLQAVAGLNYPREKLQIQVLDDSTDETRDICRKQVDLLVSRGFNIEYRHRRNRTGYKAGALQEGLATARGEFITIFDADFIPESDFLVKTLPYFTNEDTGLVQTRWGHINGSQSWLTRVQELGLNGHFIIDQEGRDKSGLFINFNGTAGIWRKSCILDAGGWHYDTLTEDLDLSYRAQLKGWKLHYCADIVTPAELPFLLSSLRTQQFRWIKGGIETSKKIIGNLWKSSHSLRVKLFGSFHLLGNYVYLFILASSILSVPVMFIKHTTPGLEVFFTLNSLFFIVFIINFSYCFTTIFVIRNNVSESLREVAAVFPMAMLVSLGMSYHNSIAVLQGVSGRKTEFVRTPKLQRSSESEGYNDERSLLSELPETILFVYFLCAVIAGIYFRDIAFIPYHLIMLFGFGVILYYAFQQSRKLSITTLKKNSDRTKSIAVD
ncbi:glycosyltransferase [Flavihumibacter sp. R14]|nr:glycosyltransferase [Flavihumibacter soli]